MQLTNTTARELHDWLSGKLGDSTYLLNEVSATHSMIYGTGSAQLYVLAILVMIEAARNTDQMDLIASLPLDGLEQVISLFRDGDYHKSKTIFEQVSNFWLKDSQKYSMAVTKSATGSTLDAPERVKTASKLLKDKSIGAKGVSGVQNTPVTGRFYKAFGESKFALDDVIANRDRYFDASGSKARQQTTHGKPMKTSDRIYDAMIRRSCKFLLYDSICEKRRVVYLLDDLDLGKVAYLTGKSGIPDDARIKGGSSDGKVPICTTELREIFRNWDYFQNHLKFYRDFHEVKPPWDAMYGKEKEWAAYANHRARKLLADPPKSMTPLQKRHLEDCITTHDGQPALAIRHFHDAQPSLYTKGASVHSVNTENETM